MKKSILLFTAFFSLLVSCSHSGKNDAEKADSIRKADSVALVEAAEAAHQEAIRQEQLRQDSIAAAKNLEENFPKVKMFISSDMGHFGFSVKSAKELGKTFTSKGYKNSDKNIYIFDEGGAHEATIKIEPKKIKNWRYEEFPEEGNDPYLVMTNVVLTFSDEEDAIKFVKSSPRKLEQIKRNKNVVTLEDSMGD